jgi:hypothetical protein
LKHKNTQSNYIFNRENPQNSEPQNGPRRGLDFIALLFIEARAEILETNSMFFGRFEDTERTF